MTIAQIKPYRKSIRLKDYDYSQKGYYFVTICTKNRKEHFGQINADEMILSQYGKIARQSWLEIPEHFEDIRLDEHVIMPNHIHGIVIIESDDEPGREQACLFPTGRTSIPKITGCDWLLQIFSNTRIKPIHDNSHFKWQKSYYDHIIRNDRSLDRIRHYIRYNALK